MIEIQEELITTLNEAAERLRVVDLPNELTMEMEKLAGQVRERCKVAVVGQVKVGKSTFVNALLGGNLAKVGDTETTATINYFSYGRPDDPERPVLCHWRGGKPTWESREFLDSLQGNDVETLRRSKGIDHLEYFLEDPFLKQVTLVDTPGTNAVVVDHQNVTAGFLALEDQLRIELQEQHNEDTEMLGSSADAVIYLTGAVARLTEKEFLEEFTKTTGGRSSALNAIGVLSKIEMQPEILVERHDLARDIAGQMREELNTVVPVGSGIHRCLDGLLEKDRAGLRRMMDTLRRIEPEDLEWLLKMDRRFFEEEDDNVSLEERRELYEALPEDIRVWQIFATIARVAADRELQTPEEVEARLRELSNFDTLEKIIKKHFIERSHLLRYYRIVSTALKVVGAIRYDHLPRRKREVPQEKARRDRFIALIHQAGGDPTTTTELESFVYRYLDVNERVKQLEKLHAELSEKFDRFHQDLIQYNLDFEALQMLEDSEHRFAETELEELRPLLGLYSGDVETRLRGRVDTNYALERQSYWMLKAQQAPFGSTRQAVAERANTRYGIIWNELTERAGVAAGAGV